MISRQNLYYTHTILIICTFLLSDSHGDVFANFVLFVSFFLFLGWFAVGCFDFEIFLCPSHQCSFLFCHLGIALGFRWLSFVFWVSRFTFLSFLRWCLKSHLTGTITNKTYALFWVSEIDSECINDLKFILKCDILDEPFAATLALLTKMTTHQELKKNWNTRWNYFVQMSPYN